MPTFKDPKYHFILSNTNQDGKRLILINFAYGYYEFVGDKKKYKVLKASTKKSIAPEYWDSTKHNQKANRKYVNKFGVSLNNAIYKIGEELTTELINFRTLNKKNPTPQELKSIWIGDSGYIKENTSVLTYLTKYIDFRCSLDSSSELFLSTRLKQQYEDLVKSLTEFEEQRKVTLYFETMTSDDYWDFFRVINEIKKTNTGLPYKVNNISRICKNLRTILNSAFLEDIKIGFKFKARGMKIQEVDSAIQCYLTKEHLTLIYNTKPLTKQEIVARNYILLSSTTGLRLEDTTKLHQIEARVFKHNKIEFFGFDTPIRKTKIKNLIFPILKPAREIIIENDGCFPKFPSFQHIRKNIKAFLKRLKINDTTKVTHRYYLHEDVIEDKPLHEVYTPHDCKDTFVTNLNQLELPEDFVALFAHPKKTKSKSQTGQYDSSTLRENAIRLIDKLKGKDSDIFTI